MRINKVIMCTSVDLYSYLCAKENKYINSRVVYHKQYEAFICEVNKKLQKIEYQLIVVPSYFPPELIKCGNFVCATEYIYRNKEKYIDNFLKQWDNKKIKKIFRKTKKRLVEICDAENE